MQSGDLSNEMASRLIVVFDNTVGFLSPKAERKRSRYLKRHQWKRAAGCWEIDPHMLKVIIDWQYRTPYNVDIATYVSEDEAEYIQERLEHASVPFGNFIVATVEEMARVYANMPHIAAIYDANPSHRFTYGAKSRAEAIL